MELDDQELEDEVNQEVLEELYDSFETYDILRAVDAVDQVRYRVCDPEELRADLLRLHGLAHELINGAFGAGEVREDETIWELALELSDELVDFGSSLIKAAEAIEPLSRLHPWMRAEKLTPLSD